MSILDKRNAWPQFNIKKLYKNLSFRMILEGDYDTRTENGLYIAKLKWSEQTLLPCSLKFQIAAFDMGGFVYATLEELKPGEPGAEGEWKTVVIDQGNAENNILNSKWNRDGRKAEGCKEIKMEILEELAGKTLRILVRSQKSQDNPDYNAMPRKGTKTGDHFNPQNTHLIHVDEDGIRKRIDKIEVPMPPTLE